MVKKNKLIEARNNKGYSQECMAAFLGKDTSSYCRKENGEIKIAHKEWIKLSEILETPLEDIYEADENIAVYFTDNASNSGNVGNNVINNMISQSTYESLNNYIRLLEEKNRNLNEENALLKEELLNAKHLTIDD